MFTTIAKAFMNFFNWFKPKPEPQKEKTPESNMIVKDIYLYDRDYSYKRSEYPYNDYY